MAVNDFNADYEFQWNDNVSSGGLKTDSDCESTNAVSFQITPRDTMAQRKATLSKLFGTAFSKPTQFSSSNFGNELATAETYEEGRMSTKGNLVFLSGRSKKK